ncbi:hypothetical protein FQA47_010529 [Oryzias melastigma]|uniref:Uncharacterized protein n=1 Tax=Oryzias melastigma TaxID=30732 RepID=A0A834FAA0_ORYME|nr:hypothetical protein FQA47_010529 [Oryzias melastigma]
MQVNTVNFKNWPQVQTQVQICPGPLDCTQTGPQRQEGQVLLCALSKCLDTIRTVEENGPNRRVCPHKAVRSINTRRENITTEMKTRPGNHSNTLSMFPVYVNGIPAWTCYSCFSSR